MHEAVEKLALELGGDTDPGILYREPHRAVRFLDAYDDRSAIWRSFDGVAQQATKRLEQQRLRQTHGRAGIERQIKHKLAMREVRPEDLQHPGNPDVEQ